MDEAVAGRTCEVDEKTLGGLELNGVLAPDKIGERGASPTLGCVGGNVEVVIMGGVAPTERFSVPSTGGVAADEEAPGRRVSRPPCPRTLGGSPAAPPKRPGMMDPPQIPPVGAEGAAAGTDDA